jgi:hypothetical protein
MPEQERHIQLCFLFPHFRGGLFKSAHADRPEGLSLHLLLAKTKLLWTPSDSLRLFVVVETFA